MQKWVLFGGAHCFLSVTCSLSPNDKEVEVSKINIFLYRVTYFVVFDAVSWIWKRIWILNLEVKNFKFSFIIMQFFQFIDPDKNCKTYTSSLLVLQAEFQRLALGFKCDMFTLEKRLRLEERSRDLAEENVRREVSSCQGLLQVRVRSGRCCQWTWMVQNVSLSVTQDIRTVFRKTGASQLKKKIKSA